MILPCPRYINCKKSSVNPALTHLRQIDLDIHLAGCGIEGTAHIGNCSVMPDAVRGLLIRNADIPPTDMSDNRIVVRINDDGFVMKVYGRQF
jgi:hypothetical protein